MLVNRVSEKGLVYRICKEIQQVNNQKTNNQLKNGQRTQVAVSSKMIYKWSISIWNDAQQSLIITEMQIETIVRYHFTLTQFSSVAQSCPPLCYPMDCNVPGLPVHHQLLELTQTHVH